MAAGTEIDVCGEVLSYHDLILGLLQAVLVRDAFELVALLHEACIFHLDAALLVHDLRDFVAHHFSHFLSDVIL